MMEFNQIHQIYVLFRNLLQAVVFSVAYYLSTTSNCTHDNKFTRSIGHATKWFHPLTPNEGGTSFQHRENFSLYRP